jgi:plasmid stabilization system protein ParE
MRRQADSRVSMSVPEFHVELSDPAKLDFRDILSHTLQMWGERRLAEYTNKIDEALRSIDDSTVYVIRILHEKIDAPRHLRHWQA